MLLLYQMISVMWMLVQRLLVYTRFDCKLFDEQPWYDVLGFLVVGLGPNGCADRQQLASSRIHGLLPSTSPYDIIDDGPTWVNFKGRKTKQVSLIDFPDS